MMRAHNFADMRGESVSEITVLEAFRIVNGSTAWECLCSCGAKLVIPGMRLRQAKARGEFLSCQACAAKAPTKYCRRCEKVKPVDDFDPVAGDRARYCKSCTPTKLTSHKTRKPRRICRTCCGLAHQVKGERCKECNQPHRALEFHFGSRFSKRPQERPSP